MEKDPARRRGAARGFAKAKESEVGVDREVPVRQVRVMPHHLELPQLGQAETVGHLDEIGGDERLRRSEGV